MKALTSTTTEENTNKLKGMQCCVVALLSHGDKGSIRGTDDREVKVDKLQSYLSECQPLRGKPKMIIMQACRGGE